MSLIDEQLALFQKLARSLDLKRNSLEYQVLEDEFSQDPSAVAKQYADQFDPDEQKLLGYIKEVDPPEPDNGADELRRLWPPPQPRPKVWTREIFARASGRRQAFLIGCNKYQHLPALQAPEKDVQATEAVLRDPRIGNFKTTAFGPADMLDAKDVEKKLTDAISAATEDDTLLLYYSGHGFSPKNGNGLYLACSNTDFTKPATAIDVNALSQAFAGSRCRSLLLILDCCQSGGVVLDVARIGKKRHRPRKGDYSEAFGFSGLRVIASSNQGQESYEEIDSNTGLSVFTGGLLNGLQNGWADLDDNGTVTDTEAFTYVRNRLGSQHLLDRQSPIHHVVEGESPFLLALNERTIEPPRLYDIPPEHVEMHLAIQGMSQLVRDSAPIMFMVMCFKYYFRDIDGYARATGLTVSPIHTPFLKASQTGFVCEAYFPPYLVPEELLLQRKPVNGVVQCGLEVRFEDMRLITGADFTTKLQWNLHVPSGASVQMLQGSI